MSIVNHAFNKYDVIFRMYLNLLPLNLVYFVLEIFWKITFPLLWKPCPGVTNANAKHLKSAESCK